MLNQGIGSWPARRARMTRQRTALVHDEQSWTYGQLAERVNRLANALHDLGVRTGDRVAYLGPNHPAFLETLFATAALGAVFVPLNTRLAAPELAHMLDDSGTSVLVWSPGLADVVTALGDRPTVRERIVVDSRRDESHSYEELLANGKPEPIDLVVGLDDVCIIMYTSGTTGLPKGAVLTHSNLVWNCYNLLIDLDLASDEVTLVSAPLFHTAALNQTALPTLLKGGTLILVSKFDPHYAFDLVAEHRVTMMFGVPAMYRQIAQSPRWPDADLSSLRVLQCGGAPVPETLIRIYQERGLTFVQGYGMTEASPGALFLRAGESVARIGSAGTPCFFTDVRIVRPDLTDTDPGETGEIILQGPNVMKGYWQRPEDTAKAITNGWFHSGDAATFDEDGFAFITDRIKDMIISGGENIYPAEVEKVIYQHPAVQDCAVVGVRDEKWGEVGCAIVVLREGASASPQEILEFLEGKLAKYKIPKTVVLTDELVRNAAGKLQRNKIKQTYAAG
jgi:fatty-acyl-CoA synthase